MASQENFVGAAQEVGLSAKEKDRVFQNVRAFMDAHPVRRGFFYSLRETFVHPLTWRTLPVTAVLVLFLLSAGGLTAFAAEDALPGDILYPMKVYVTEPVVERLQLSTEARARWNMRRVERRLQEVQRLQAKSTLSARRRSELNGHLQRNVQMLEQRIAQMEDAGSSQEAMQLFDLLETSLSEHETALKVTSKEQADGGGEMLKFTNHLREVREQVSRHRNIRAEKLREGREEIKAAAEEGETIPSKYRRKDPVAVSAPAVLPAETSSTQGSHQGEDNSSDGGNESSAMPQRSVRRDGNQRERRTFIRRFFDANLRPAKIEPPQKEDERGSNPVDQQEDVSSDLPVDLEKERDALPLP